MKNLLIYINPNKKFSEEYDELTKIQIDNSLELDWKPKDIVLVTNFDYQYRGIKSIVIGDYSYFDDNRSTKIPAILELFKKNLIEEGTVYWFHDHDAFQLIPFEVDLDTDARFTVFQNPQIWNAGSFFFKKSAEGIFADIWHYMIERETNEQDALTYMWQNNVNEIKNRYRLINIAYNMGIYNIQHNLDKADFPIIVAHFHPHRKRHMDLYTSRNLLPERLLK